jgi:hypothetical protein
MEQYIKLGEKLSSWLDGKMEWSKMESAVEVSQRDNPFFLAQMQRYALREIAASFLNLETLRGLEFGRAKGKSVGVVCAGNIPAVGFLDIFAPLVSGAIVKVKLSSKDLHILPLLFPENEFNVKYLSSEEFEGEAFDALITMGGKVASDYFNKRYANIPRVVRGSRQSGAIIRGDESSSQLEGLAGDMLLYFGLGCRSVSFIFVPQGYDFTPLGDALKSWFPKHGMHIPTIFKNNYLRCRAVGTLNDVEMVDASVVILMVEKGEVMGTPQIGSVSIRFYSSDSEINSFLLENRGHIQKIYTNFGTAQSPSVDDFPDEVDVFEFLKNL